jgi:hypothetical protein
MRTDSSPRRHYRIPYAGSKYACYEERARQASEILDTDSRERVEADEILTRNQCTACPTIRHHEITKQENDDDTELVPGGLLRYVLFEKAPGIQLDWNLFWSWDREERDAVRSAFREAWLYVESIYSCGCPQRILSPDRNRSLVLFRMITTY